MRKLILSNNVTLDSRIDEPREWALAGDAPEFIEHQGALLDHTDGLLMGRRTYEFFAAVWPSRSGEFADRFNGIAKHVASTTLGDLEWENSARIEGDVPEAVAALKEEPGGDLVLYGSHDLMHSLLGRGLIDEFQLWVYPLVLGRGRRLFDDGVEQLGLELVDALAIPGGITILTYRA